MENPIKMDDLGVPLFLKTSKSVLFNIILNLPHILRQSLERSRGVSMASTEANPTNQSAENNTHSHENNTFLLENCPHKNAFSSYFEDSQNGLKHPLFITQPTLNFGRLAVIWLKEYRSIFNENTGDDIHHLSATKTVSVWATQLHSFGKTKTEKFNWDVHTQCEEEEVEGKCL